jgi:PAS domain S-box-containing protein
MSEQLKRSEKVLQLGKLRREAAELERELDMGEASSGPFGALGDADAAAALALLDRYAGDFLSIHAANGDYVYASPAATTLFGWRPEVLVGTNAYAYFHEQDMARIATSHAAHGEGAGGVDRVRYRLRCASGEFRWVETVSRPYREAGHVRSIVCITRDVHEAELATQRAEAAEVDLVRAYHHRFAQQLANAIAHELNNPLTTAMLALARASKAPGDKDAVAQVAQALERMREVIRELTMLAAMSSEVEVVDVAATVRRVVELADIAAYQPRLELESAVLQAAPAQLYHLVYSMLQLHTHLVTAATGAGLVIECARAGEAVRIEIRSLTSALEGRARADLLGALRGTAREPDTGLRLAKSICEADLRGAWSTQVDAESLRTTALIPATCAVASPVA